MRAQAPIVAIVLFIVGCAPSARPSAPAPVTVRAAPGETSLGRHFEAVIRQHADDSGFQPINDGRDAFAVRVALAEKAERSIDAQYFLWDADSVGTILMHRLMLAADRGVHVRLLVDDLYVKGRDAGIAGLDAHPNIEIRLYNPSGGRNPLSVGRRLDFLLEFRRLNHRMHNKLFVVDDQVAVAGGRNIADAYFGVDPRLNYRDLDLVTVGPIVRQLSQGFDVYWNSRWALPISAMRGPPSSKRVNRVYEWIARESERHLASFPYAHELQASRMAERLRTLPETLIWAPGQAVWTDPESGPTGSTAGAPSAVAVALGSLVDTTRLELVTESPYFVPSADMPAVRQLRGRGVGTRVLTNSLASTDEPPAYAVYAKERRRLLQEGVELYEIRPDAASRALYTADPTQHHRLALHAKVAVFDRQTVYVGSFNLDPRSRSLNTEIALLVRSAPLAQRVLDLLDPDFEPQNSWRLILEPDRRHVAWVTEPPAEPARYSRAPATSAWERFTTHLVALLPIRGQL